MKPVKLILLTVLVVFALSFLLGFVKGLAKSAPATPADDLDAALKKLDETPAPTPTPPRNENRQPVPGEAGP